MKDKEKANQIDWK